MVFLKHAWVVWAVLLVTLPSAAQADQSPLALLNQANHFALMRHALAPGTGDPVNFSLEDCATQRNLNGAGRDQARAIGDALREAGVDDALVFSSQWCRCMETGDLLKLGPVIPLPALNSFFRDYQRGPEQLKTLRAWLDDQPLLEPTILVTHQVVITGLTEVFPSSGELLIMQRKASGELALIDKVLIK